MPEKDVARYLQKLNGDIEEGVGGHDAQVVVAEIEHLSDGRWRACTEETTTDQRYTVIVQVPEQSHNCHQLL